MVNVLTLASLFTTSLAIVLNVSDYRSIRNVAASTVYSVQQLYNGNKTGGVLGKWPYPPYYWWESGGAWGGMMHYWALSNDSSYNNVMMQALVSQLGPKYDFVKAEEAFDTGNDDQAFWAFIAMSAAEYGFPAPPNPAPSWLTIVDNAFNDYVFRWSSANCGGGLKWQFYPSNAGFFYKNAISNGAFFQLSARLYRFTGNTTYLDWSNIIWDWSQAIGLVDDIYNVFDGSDEKINCSALDHTQWTYNVGVYLYGAAVLSNITNATQLWVDRTAGLLAATDTFFSPFPNATNVMFEAKCEMDSSCNTDQWAMKAFLTRWLSGTSVMAPYTTNRIGYLLRASALGAADACTGGSSGITCGSKWYIGGYDGITGLGQQLSAMDVFTALLVNYTTRVPTTLPNVTVPIYVAPLNTTPPVSEPTGSRPLYDNRHNAGSRHGRIIARLLDKIPAAATIGALLSMTVTNVVS